MQKFLELQRASAGSGKTYSLAKKFLWLFLTIHDNEEHTHRRLRTSAELRDSLRHILAVTFTNKATNEMQQRIVEKLYQLAFSQKSPKDIHYLIDFCKKLKGSDDITAQDIEALREVCRKAIYILLENYSDFQVSTIDSFFQLVLRTFAYETELNDSYGIELDSEFLSKMGVDNLFEDIEEGRATSNVAYWLDVMMKNSRDNGKGWNIFQRRTSTGTYSEFIESLKKLQHEDFKDIRAVLENYFRETPDFIILYEKLCNKYDSIPKQPHKDMMTHARKVVNIINSMCGELPTFITGTSGVKSHAEKTLQNKSIYTLPSYKTDYVPKSVADFDNKNLKKLRDKDSSLFDNLKMEYAAMIKYKEKWISALKSPEFKHWSIYKKQFPVLGLLSITLSKREQYLKDNNNVELSETNSLLRQIIGKDDTPFIYERLGTRLNHFLIDEFQDTSRLQWENFKPLLDESIARGQENLLIGDAKQSIYRFRNADPSLISHKVQQIYPDLTPLGDAPEENTNRRSDRTVVNFNNHLFHFLSSEIENNKLELLPSKSFSSKFNFKNLYGNVIQNFNDKEDRGYVSINMINANSQEYDEPMSIRLIKSIEDILSRGFNMGDIAVLVDTNTHGDFIIKTFLEYNSKIENIQKLEFISEESLKLKSSSAIGVILSVLETISHGTNPDTATDDNSKRRSINWNQIKSNFRLYCMKNKIQDVAPALEKFLKEGVSADAISEMLSTMQAVTLPALVEGITAYFLSDELRKNNAPYLAAFQDVVLEYCDSHPSDISSFLDWWNKRKDNLSISSPEGINAINVTTIHKSKGLEYPCVLVPYADCSFLNTNPQKKEWSWVTPEVIGIDEYTLPPFIPVDTDQTLKGTLHEDKFWQTVEMRTMDNLNSLYVAFTRAVNELYIFCRNGKRQSNSFTGFLNMFLDSDAVDSKCSENSENAKIIEIGKPLSPEDIIKVHLKKAEENKSKNKADYVTLVDYKSNQKLGFLKCKDEEQENRDDDSRSEGNILHDIMQRVTTPEDIPSAVRYFQRKGLYSKDDAARTIEFLNKKITESEAKVWFNSKWRVVNERAIIWKSEFKRPDRIIIDKDRNAVIIDYKFGQNRDDTNYGLQVKKYVDRLKETGKFLSVKGYIWYVRDDIIIYVCD